MKEAIVIYGAGGLAREVYNSFIRDYEEYNFLGFIDDNVEVNSEVIDNKKVIGNKNTLINSLEDVLVIIAIANPFLRKRIVCELEKSSHIHFPSIVSKKIINSSFNEIGKGAIVCDGSILTVNVKIKDFAIINPGCFLGHEVVVNEFATIYPKANISGNTEIGVMSEIGLGSNVIQGLKIGDNSIIGAGAVVVKDIPSNCTAVGVPAKPIKYHNKEE